MVNQNPSFLQTGENLSITTFAGLNLNNIMPVACNSDPNRSCLRPWNRFFTGSYATLEP